MSFIRSIILSSILSVFGTAFSPLIAQQNTFDCNVLWDKLQASNLLLSYSSAKSENYFYKEYCGCLQATGDTTKLNQFRYVTNLSAFSGGYAFENTHWYSAVVDTNFKEISKTLNKEAQYIGYGFYVEPQFGKLILMDPFGKEIKTPKGYKTIKVLSSSKTGNLLFIGVTGLTCDAFTKDGVVQKTWEGITNIDVFTHRILILNSSTVLNSTYVDGKELTSIYTADLEELIPFVSGKLHSISNQLIFISEKNEALVFDNSGNLKYRQTGVQCRFSKTEFKLTAAINGKWMNYNIDKGMFDSLIPNETLSNLGYSLVVHPQNKITTLIRNSKFEPVFEEPVGLIEQLDENWFAIQTPTQAVLWNPKTGKKIKQPKTYAEAKVLNTGEIDQEKNTVFPYFYSIRDAGDTSNRVKSKNLKIYESYSYNASGIKNKVIRQDYKWNMTEAHLVVKNGYCFNYNVKNQLVDSFPVDTVYELHKNNLANFSDHSEFIPLMFSWKGKRGLFYLGTAIRVPAIYDDIYVDDNNIFRIYVRQNGLKGMIDPYGKQLVPMAYSSLILNDFGTITAIERINDKYKVSTYFVLPHLLPSIDSTIEFVPSYDRRLIVKTHSVNSKGICYDLDKGANIDVPNNHYYSIKKDLYLSLDIVSKFQLVDNQFKPIFENRFYNYCIMPNGVYLEKDMSLKGDGYYSFKTKNIERLNYKISHELDFANQLIVEKDSLFYLINADGVSVKLPQGYRYKITNHSGFVYYSLLDDSALWGLMKVDGTKVTEMLFNTVFAFEGEHGIVWNNGYRFYIDKLGKTFPF